jgi:hypothetical protein
MVELFVKALTKVDFYTYCTKGHGDVDLMVPTSHDLNLQPTKKFSSANVRLLTVSRYSQYKSPERRPSSLVAGHYIRERPGEKHMLQR